MDPSTSARYIKYYVLSNLKLPKRYQNNFGENRCTLNIVNYTYYTVIFLVKTVGFKIEIVNGLERIYLRNISAYLSISERDGCEGRQALLSSAGLGGVGKLFKNKNKGSI